MSKTHKHWVSRTQLIRVIVAMILTSAAFAKAHDARFKPMGIGDNEILLALILVELFVAAWLISGIYSTLADCISCALFGLFVVLQFLAINNGVESCRCFGRLNLSPVLMLTVDLLVVVTQLLNLRYWRSGYGWSFELPYFLRWLIAYVALSISVVLYSDNTIQESDGLRLRDNYVVCDTDRWVGREFPLLRFMPNGDMLESDEWVVILLRDGCDRCDQVRNVYSAGLESIIDRRNPRVAFIELPPHSSSMSQHAHFLKINDDRFWYSKTPLELCLRDGIVVAISSDLERLREISTIQQNGET